MFVLFETTTGIVVIILHINLRFHEVRNYAKDLCHVKTDRNLADPLTKPVNSANYLNLFFPHNQAEEAHVKTIYGASFGGHH